MNSMQELAQTRAHSTTKATASGTRVVRRFFVKVPDPFFFFDLALGADRELYSRDSTFSSPKLFVIMCADDKLLQTKLQEKLAHEQRRQQLASQKEQTTQVTM
jgi:hypothetical protein